MHNTHKVFSFSDSNNRITSSITHGFGFFWTWYSQAGDLNDIWSGGTDYSAVDSRGTVHDVTDHFLYAEGKNPSTCKNGLGMRLSRYIDGVPGSVPSGRGFPDVAPASTLLEQFFLTTVYTASESLSRVSIIMQLP